MVRPPPRLPLFPYTTLFRSLRQPGSRLEISVRPPELSWAVPTHRAASDGDGSARHRLHHRTECEPDPGRADEDRKSTRLNSSHQISSYAVLCLKKKQGLPGA